MTVSSLSRDPMLMCQHRLILSEEIEVRSDKVSQPNLARKVNFNETVRVRSAIHLNEMTDDEIADSWFSRKEMSEIKRRMASDIKVLRSGKPLEGSTSRGLEYRTLAGATKRKANKENALDAVLDEQERQAMRMIHDPENIRNAYLTVSRACHVEAHALAKSDEIEVLQLILDPSEI
jgi:uncharacterized protein YjiS (DUF1127 family)